MMARQARIAVLLSVPIMLSAGAVAAQTASGDGEPPLSRDALFGDAPAKDDDASPASRDALFELAPAEDQATKTMPPAAEALPAATETAGREATPWRGYFQAGAARTYADPAHWSKLNGRLELGRQGHLGEGVKWKVSGRLDYDAVYAIDDFYPKAVRDDQRDQFQLRETYLDFSGGGWDWRVGRQHVVWGEMVGLFFADVVSAKDLREFVLPDFETLRIPQWAVRAEYFKNDFHVELAWIPFPGYNEIGKPGAEFYAYPALPDTLPGLPVIRGEDKPGYGFDHGNFGGRVSVLKQGWDVSAFYYSSMDSSATFYRDPVVVAPSSTPQLYFFTPRHERIWQAGGTLAKDLGSAVLKAEAVYTDGRKYNVQNLTDPDGVVVQNTLDWVAGLDFSLESDTRINTQFFQRIHFDHDPDIIPDKWENGMSLLVNHTFTRNWEAEALLIHSLNRSDWMFRPKVMWGFQPNWKLSLGLDVFGGPPDRLFGQFDSKDRAYAEVRYDF